MIVTVSDAGCGFDEKNVRAGFGLVSLRERLEGLGGSLQFHEGRPGTRVSMIAPLVETQARSGADGHEPDAGDGATR